MQVYHTKFFAVLQRIELAMEHITLVLKHLFTLTNIYRFWLRGNRGVILTQPRG